MRKTALIICALTVAGCGGGGSNGKPQLNGAGSTLVAPLVAQWANAYDNAAVVYSGIGSGGGVAQITNRTVDFGASDAPLQGDQRKPRLVQIPWALAATVVAVNLPGVSAHPRLTGSQLADIYLGKTRYWDEVDAGLPHLRIAPVYRSDSSGDTFVFSSYLASVSPAWRAKVGSGVDVSWPAGSGAKGNAGMTAALQQTKGAIAYIAIGQAKAAGLNFAVLRNAAGQYPEPTPAAIASRAYPLWTYTYVIVDRRSAKLAVLKPFLRYAVTDGQSSARALSFAPLPANVRRADLKLIDGL